MLRLFKAFLSLLPTLPQPIIPIVLSISNNSFLIKNAIHERTYWVTDEALQPGA